MVNYTCFYGCTFSLYCISLKFFYQLHYLFTTSNDPSIASVSVVRLCCAEVAHVHTIPAIKTAAGRGLPTRGRAPAKLFLLAVRLALVTHFLQLSYPCTFRVSWFCRKWLRTSMLSVTSYPRSTTTLYDCCRVLRQKLSFPRSRNLL